VSDVGLRGLTYIHTCRSYVHTARDHVFGSQKDNECERRGGGGALANMSDFGLLGEQSSQKWEIPCLGHRLTAVQNLTPLALSSVEKSVTVQTNKHTVTNIFTPCLSACVDNNGTKGPSIESPVLDEKIGPCH